jgi:hypothetical protein
MTILEKKKKLLDLYENALSQEALADKCRGTEAYSYHERVASMYKSAVGFVLFDHVLEIIATAEKCEGREYTAR